MMYAFSRCANVGVQVHHQRKEDGNEGEVVMSISFFAARPAFLSFIFLSKISFDRAFSSETTK
jgi:hypothetical protein